MRKKIVEDNFSGMLDLQEIGNNKCDSFFNICNNVVTIIPLTNECRKHVHTLSYTDGSNDRNSWVYGYSEKGYSVAFLKKTALKPSISAPVDMGTARFYTPIIVQNTVSNGSDLRTFNVIEFRGGIIDILHVPTLMIDEDYENRSIKFLNKDVFTKEYNVEVNGENIIINYSIDADELVMNADKLPDLRDAIHSTMRLELETEKPLCDIEKYYSYAMSFFQFCAGRLNINFEIRLYKHEMYEGKKITNPSPVLVKIQDGFDDYANNIINFTNVIRLQFLGEKLPILFKLLNEEKSKPYLLFLQKRNSNANNILYTDIGDLCVSFEREFSLSKIESNEQNKNAAKLLAEQLLRIINEEEDCPEEVKTKANSILNSQLKGFTPSLKEKIYYFYDEFEKHIKSITEKETHVKFGISKVYEPELLKKKISKFVAIRNKASHVGIIWNDGVDVFSHLKLLIYFSILRRADYSLKESVVILSWLFSREF